jgi:multiple sugar transport system permease protein
VVGAVRPLRTLASQERRFALSLLLPALLVLLLTTTTPLVYLVWNSLHRLDLGMRRVSRDWRTMRGWAATRASGIRSG